MDNWSKVIIHQNLSKICLKLVKIIKHLSRNKQRWSNFILIIGVLDFQKTAKPGNGLYFGGSFSYSSHRLLRFNLRYVRPMHIAGCFLQNTIIWRYYKVTLTCHIVTLPISVTFPHFFVDPVCLYKMNIRENFLYNKQRWRWNILFTQNIWSLASKL